MTSKEVLIEYLKVKTEEQDWHAVSDAANDLRVLEARQGDYVPSPTRELRRWPKTRTTTKTEYISKKI